MRPSFRLLPDSIAGRTILVLLVGLTVSHLISMGAYHAGLEHEIGAIGERQFAERLAAARRTLAGVAEQDRDRAAHSLSGGGIEIHWTRESLAPAGTPRGDEAELARNLETDAPELAALELRVGYGNPEPKAGPPARHALLVSSQLPDGSWVDATLPMGAPRAAGSWDLVLSTTLMALAVIVMSALSVRILTAPLRSLSQAAERLGVNASAAPFLDESGPREIRQAARAFNEMQARIRKLIEDRTQMLAAISHDLKTPITRLRLRAELVDDDEAREKMLADLEEMESMIASTLAFLRQDAVSEEVRVIDLSTMLSTICDDMADAGHAVELEVEGRSPLRCRPLALKRALVNLVDNAVKYGGRARVRLTYRDNQVRIDVEDEGPGIPESERERVFAPFYRMEASRSRETGGTGLGLSVARSVVRAHGGDIALAAGELGGLRATVVLPIAL